MALYVYYVVIVLRVINSLLEWQPLQTMKFSQIKQASSRVPYNSEGKVDHKYNLLRYVWNTLIYGRGAYVHERNGQSNYQIESKGWVLTEPDLDIDSIPLNQSTILNYAF